MPMANMHCQRSLEWRACQTLGCFISLGGMLEPPYTVGIISRILSIAILFFPQPKFNDYIANDKDSLQRLLQHSCPLP